MTGSAAVSTRATMALTNTINEQDFKTPDRSTAKSLSAGSDPEEKKEDVLTSSGSAMNTTRPSANMVTPPDSFTTAAANETRFDGKKGGNKSAPAIEAKTLCSVGSDGGDSTTSSPTASQRGLVSRRGGRCGSPSRRNLVPPPATGPKASKEAADAAAAVLEFKTFRSPERKKNEDESNDTSLAAVTKENKPKTKLTKKAAPTGVPGATKKSSGVTFSPVPTPKGNSDRVSLSKLYFCPAQRYVSTHLHAFDSDPLTLLLPF